MLYFVEFVAPMNLFLDFHLELNLSTSCLKQSQSGFYARVNLMYFSLSYCPIICDDLIVLMIQPN